MATAPSQANMEGPSSGLHHLPWPALLMHFQAAPQNIWGGICPAPQSSRSILRAGFQTYFCSMARAWFLVGSHQSCLSLQRAEAKNCLKQVCLEINPGCQVVRTPRTLKECRALTLQMRKKKARGEMCFVPIMQPISGKTRMETHLF